MKNLKFLVSLPTRDNDFQTAQASSAQQTAGKLGIGVDVIYAENDAVNQSTQILKAVQAPAGSRPDAVVLEPVSGTALPQVARAACAAGIGWVVLNRAPDYLPELRRTTANPIFSVGSDHVEIGRIQGRQFEALLPKGGSVLYLEGPSHSSSAQKRTTGMLETKPSNVQVTMLKGRWTEESAQRAVRSWLQLATSQSTTINLVGAQDDSMAMGARKAFEDVSNDEERRRWLKLPFTGCDGQPATGQAWVNKGWLTATIYIPPLAGRAVEILAKALQSGTQPAEHSLTESYSIPSLDVLAAKGS